jgi:hypothetical protein
MIKLGELLFVFVRCSPNRTPCAFSGEFSLICNISTRENFHCYSPSKTHKWLSREALQFHYVMKYAVALDSWLQREFSSSQWHFPLDVFLPLSRLYTCTIFTFFYFMWLRDNLSCFTRRNNFPKLTLKVGNRTDINT